MKNRKNISMLCAISVSAFLSLTGCAGGADLGQSETTEVSGATGSGEAAGQVESTEEAETTEMLETTEKSDLLEDKKVRLHIEGYSNENIPRLDGSLANEPLLIRIMSELTETDAETAESYMAESFANGGTSTSWGKLIYDNLDLIISYEPPYEVKDDYREEFKYLEIDALGRDGLVFIVNVNNPIDSLTVDQIRDIYTGKITDWSELGGEPGKIKAFQRNSTSGSQTLLNKLVMNGEQTVEPEKDLLVGTMAELIESVAGFDGDGSSIGFSVYYYAEKMKSDPQLKMIKVEGVAPSNASIEDGSYPLVNDFYVAIQANESQNSPARALRDWLLTEEGKKLLEEEGYVWARTGMEAVSAGTENPIVQGW